MLIICKITDTWFVAKAKKQKIAFFGYSLAEVLKKYNSHCRAKPSDKAPGVEYISYHQHRAEVIDIRTREPISNG